ncbi:MAG: hypothetical protein AAFV85_20990 [Cyanobacteria bacterium J06634_6]
MKGLLRIYRVQIEASLACMQRLLEGMCEHMPECIAFGRVKKENTLLVQRLAALRADYNRLKQEMSDLLHHTDEELSALKETNTGLAREFDDLQLRVWELEQQVDELLLYIAQLSTEGIPAEDGPLEATVEQIPDLSYLSLGIVGGHPATVREVVNELNVIYGLQRWVVVPPTWESSLKKSVLKGKLKGCDLIVIVTGYMNHSLTDAVLGLNTSGGIPGKVVLLNFRGKSGVVREILRQVALLGDLEPVL